MATKQTVLGKTSEAFHIRHRNFFVGLFLTLPAVVLPLVLLFTVGKSELLEKKYFLYLKINGPAVVKEGNAVKILDCPVGSVKKVTLDTNRVVTVKFMLREAYIPLVKKDARALVKLTSPVMGEGMIELLPGSPGSPPIQNGDVLQVENPPDIVAQAMKMVEMVQAILKDVTEGRGTVGKLIVEDSLINLIQKTIRDADRTVNTADHTVKDLNGSVSRTLGNLDTTLVTFTKMGTDGMVLVDSLLTAVTNINGLLAAYAPLADSLADIPAQLDKTMGGVQSDLKELEKLLRAIQKHPLIRKQVKEVEDEDAGKKDEGRRSKRDKE
jgi:phospholipid/cholesterol/gamma-HCH transport system substrate-binding protein